MLLKCGQFSVDIWLKSRFDKKKQIRQLDFQEHENVDLDLAHYRMMCKTMDA